MNHRWRIALLFFFLNLNNQLSAFNSCSKAPTMFRAGNNTALPKSIHRTQNFRPKTSGPSVRDYGATEHYSDHLAAAYADQARQCEKEYEQYQKKLFESGACLNFANINHTTKLLKIWNQQLALAKNSNDSYRTTWLTRRIAALQQTLASKKTARYYGDEVNTKFTTLKEHPQLCLYGTELDKVLFQELQATQDLAYYLKDQLRGNIHAQAMAPMIIEHTAQAKHERDIAIAFSRADFSHDLLAIACYGIEENTKGALGLRRGITNAIKTVISPAHWKQIVIDMAHLIRFVAKEYTEFEMLERAFDDPDHERRAKFYERYAHDHKVGPGDHIATFMQNSYATFCDKTLEKKLESCAELFTTLALESVIIGAAIHGASVSGRALVSEVATIFKQGPTAIAEYGAEIAGVGKLVVQEGETMVLDALKIVEKHPNKFFKKNATISEILYEEMCNDSIWDFIIPTGPMYNQTKIPRSFKLTVKNQRFWIHPNATKHMPQYLLTDDKIRHLISIDSQILLKSLKLEIERAMELGIFKPKTKIHLDRWEIAFKESQGPGLCPTIYHANFFPGGKPKGKKL